jgi:type IV pilus assembly protein PilV
MKKLRAEKGFTLIEVMVSVVILAIGLLGLAPMMAISITGNSFANEATRATVLAQDKIEELKNTATFASIPQADSTDIDGQFSLISRVDNTASDGSVPGGVYKIFVRVRWSDQAEVDRRLEFFTYRTQ